MFRNSTTSDFLSSSPNNLLPVLTRQLLSLFELTLFSIIFGIICDWIKLLHGVGDNIICSVWLHSLRHSFRLRCLCFLHREWRERHEDIAVILNISLGLRT